MARSQLTVTEVTRAGVARPAQQSSDATNDHYIASTDTADYTWWMEVENTDASPQTVTVIANPDLSADGLTVSDYTNTIAAGVTEVMGPFRYKTFRQATDSNRIYIDPSVTTNLKFRVYKITPVS